MTHSETIRAALNLTAEEFDRIIAALGFTAGTKLTVTGYVFTADCKPIAGARPTSGPCTS